MNEMLIESKPKLSFEYKNPSFNLFSVYHFFSRKQCFSKNLSIHTRVAVGAQLMNNLHCSPINFKTKSVHLYSNSNKFFQYHLGVLILFFFKLCSFIKMKVCKYFHPDIIRDQLRVFIIIWKRLLNFAMRKRAKNHSNCSFTQNFMYFATRFS